MIDALTNNMSVVLNAPTGSGKTTVTTAVLKELMRKAYVYVRTISQYTSWEREARRFGLKFSGLMRKAEFCRIEKKPYKLYCTLCGKEVDENHDRDHKKYVGRMYFKPLCYDPNEGFCQYRREAVASSLEHGDRGLFNYELWKKRDELLASLGVKGTANWFRDNYFEFMGSKYEVCIYKEMLNGDFDLKLFSYIYFFGGIARPEKGELVVMDEAHNLDDIMSNGVSIHLNEVRDYLSKLGLDKATFNDAVEQFRKFLKDPLSGYPYMKYLDEDLVSKVTMIINAFKEEDKWYIERGDSFVRVMPADPSIWTGQLNNYQYILLSGTMPSESYIRDVWGLTNFVYIKLTPDFLKYHFSGLTVKHVGEFEYTLKNRDTYRDRVVEIIKENLAKDGINLIVVPSYDELDAMKKYFKDAFYESSNPFILEEVKGLPDGAVVIAVAGGKLTEGIEVTDKDGVSRIKRVFIVGLPIPQYKDPYLDTEISTVAKRLGRDPEAFKWVILTEKAVNKVLQAIGRAIRGPRDSATVFLIDKRFGRSDVKRLISSSVKPY
jgi:Rad3-related DNA helicase